MLREYEVFSSWRPSSADSRRRSARQSVPSLILSGRRLEIRVSFGQGSCQQSGYGHPAWGHYFFAQIGGQWTLQLLLLMPQLLEGGRVRTGQKMRGACTLLCPRHFGLLSLAQTCARNICRQLMPHGGSIRSSSARSMRVNGFCQACSLAASPPWRCSCFEPGPGAVTPVPLPIERAYVMGRTKKSKATAVRSCLNIEGYMCGVRCSRRKSTSNQRNLRDNPDLQTQPRRLFASSTKLIPCTRPPVPPRLEAPVEAFVLKPNRNKAARILLPQIEMVQRGKPKEETPNQMASQRI